MTTVVHRDRIISPSRYRRRTVGLVYSLQNTQSVPNSARLASTPRSSSALDHRWVHRSQGDLTADMDLQAHPRLQSDFYQELYQKYPHAFRRRLESRETGRKLFNSGLHVRFKDNAESCDENHVSPGNFENMHSNTQLTNWDREVGHYMKHKSRSRDCITSLEPSECSGSVLSVTQRLRLNSKSLNKLLNGDSPFKKHSARDFVQYDSGTDNEQSLQAYMLEKSKERSRHRKKQRRIIIQRNFQKNVNVDKEINKENEFNSRRWMSKSASPTRRHLMKYSLPPENKKHESHQVNVESLIADSDLKIDTLLEKIGTKMSSPDSPPDSAIDIDTPSVQSLAATDAKGVNSGNPDKELPTFNGQQTASFESPQEDVESSPGSSASTYASRKRAKTPSDITQREASNDKACCENKLEDNFSVEVTKIENKTDEFRLREEEELNKIVEKYASSENLNRNNTGAGLLQLYSEDLGYSNAEGFEVATAKVDDIKVDTTQTLPVEYSTSSKADTLDCVVDAKNAFEENLRVGFTDDPDHSAEEADIKHVKDKKKKIEQVTDIDDYDEQIDDIEEIPKDPDFDECAPGSPQSVENVNYHADDEHEADVVAMETAHRNGAVSKRITNHRESDVDSGLGYSSAGTDMLPPRGRAAQRETTKKTQPIKASHDILPIRSEVDVDILDEVNLVHLSRDLLKSHDPSVRGGKSTRQERDDTDARLGVTKPSERDRKLAEKYRRARSPSPFILRNKQPSPSYRPKSAPSFAQSATNLTVVDIPLTNEAFDSVQNAMHYGEDSHQKVRSNMKSNGTIKTNSCQSSDTISKYSSMPNLPGNPSKHSKFNAANDKSSKLARQRQCSVTSDSSISLLSEGETDAVHSIHNENYGGAIEQFESSPEGAIENDHEKDISDERFSEVELDFGGNSVNVIEKEPHAVVKVKKGMYQPGVTSPRVQEKRLKIRNILKHKKGSYTPSEESRKIPDEKNVVNRIYAKAHGAEARGLESIEKLENNNVDPLRQKSVEVNGEDLTKETVIRVEVHKDRIENSSGRRTPYESAVSTGQDSESVDQFITGASNNTVQAKPVVLDDVGSASELVKTDMTGDALGERLSVESGEIAISPSKAQPPKKPARNKHKKKNLNALADQLNFAKYKIRVEEEPSAETKNGGEIDQSEQSPRAQAIEYEHIEDPSSKGHIPGQRPELGKGSSLDTNSEIEAWQPLKSTTAVTDNTAGKKRGSKGKFRFFKKASSMDQGIETIGVDPNPGAQGSKGSKGSQSIFPKVKKAPSLKSFTSLFSRKKKKKGQFVIEDAENAGQGSSLSRSEQAYGLQNGTQQQQYASCHSLDTVGSHGQIQPIREPVTNQPIRKLSKDTTTSRQGFQPIGRLLKVNPDGTQVVQLFKPENGPIGFFIAKGNAKSGNGIFVSRFVETRPEQCFAGLLGIGDEIIEVNGHLVRDFTQDTVYSLISASAVVLVKVLPLIARNDL